MKIRKKNKKADAINPLGMYIPKVDKNSIKFNPDKGSEKALSGINNSTADGAVGMGCSSSGGCSEAFDYIDKQDNSQQDALKKEVDRVSEIFLKFLSGANPYNSRHNCQIDIERQYSKQKDFWELLNNRLKQSRIDYDIVDKNTWADIKDLVSTLTSEKIDVQPFDSYIVDAWYYTDDHDSVADEYEKNTQEQNQPQQDENEQGVEDSFGGSFGKLPEETDTDVDSEDISFDSDEFPDSQPLDVNQEGEGDFEEGGFGQLPESLNTVNEEKLIPPDSVDEEVYSVVDKDGKTVQSFDNAKQAINFADSLGNAQVISGDGEQYYITDDSNQQEDGSEQTTDSATYSEGFGDLMHMTDINDEIDQRVGTIIDRFLNNGQSTFKQVVNQDIAEDFIDTLECEAVRCGIEIDYDFDDMDDGSVLLKIKLWDDLPEDYQEADY